MCLFKLWPTSHAGRVKANLDECFETKVKRHLVTLLLLLLVVVVGCAAFLQSSVKMPISMRQAVFDSWYEKELGKEAAEVCALETVMRLSLIHRGRLGHRSIIR